MRHTREILRQKWVLGRSHREVARSLGAAMGPWARRCSEPGPPQPDCAYLHAERRKPSVTLELLRLEYRERYPDGYRYTQFCEFYRRWLQRSGLSMRQVHRAGEKCFTAPSCKLSSRSACQLQRVVRRLSPKAMDLVRS